MRHKIISPRPLGGRSTGYRSNAGKVDWPLWYDLGVKNACYIVYPLKAQSPHSDYVTRCYFNLCLQQGSRDDRVSREANMAAPINTPRKKVDPYH